jgi:4-hydroxy-3-polyprenylbenzoate decarboxylase
MVSNLFGTLERARFMFRDTLRQVERLVELKIDPAQAIRRPWRYAATPLAALGMLPKSVRRGAITAHRTTIRDLPQQVSWQHDAGAFITLPQVYTEDVERPGMAQSNLGMYRIQISGGQYEPDREVGLHYQIHRSIGVHQAAAMRAGKPFQVNIFVGGPPAMTLAAVMPLPEGMSELMFAGALAGHRIRMLRLNGNLPVHADTDFCLTGVVDPEKMLPEGPFGDHLGYYSLAHPFPVLRVENVYHRPEPIWPFTVVGRPPQEDTIFGQLIHELTGPVIPSVLPGVKAVHAVDAAGVHPLLLAIGSERYMPFLQTARPQELLTQAHAILGQGQLSLAKFLLIAAHQDNPHLDIYDVAAFLKHVLERADWSRDLHFQTQTTIDTLDYSGSALNAGSKLVVAAVGPKRFELATSVPAEWHLPHGFRHPRLVLPGVLAIEGPALEPPSLAYDPRPMNSADIERFCTEVSGDDHARGFRWIVVVDDSQFVAESLRNFLWVTFTRANPAADVYGVNAFWEQKHWGSRGALVIDSRLKPHHAPPLMEDAQITRRVDALAAHGGPLHGIL